MGNDKLYLVMVGLPARGKSTIARKVKENLVKEGIKTRIFNNGLLRRQMFHRDTSHPSFFDPGNTEGAEIRRRIADINMARARKFLGHQGQVAVFDATNVQKERRDRILSTLNDHPLLFLECINDDQEILKASIERKIILPEFDNLDRQTAIQHFRQRIGYYERLYCPVVGVRNYIKLDSLNNLILAEDLSDYLPHYDLIRDLLVTDNVKSLYLVRHGETYFNLENRIGGDSALTPQGEQQALGLAHHFKKRKLSVIFPSSKQRTIRMAEVIKTHQERCLIIPIEEFDEIDGGVCEGMSYEEIRDRMPEIYYARKQDKYDYVYPRGEGYVTMRERIERGIKKALYLSDRSDKIMIVGHRATNRMILSHFLYRRKEDVPYIFIPQDKYYHIVSVHNKKLFQLKSF